MKVLLADDNQERADAVARRLSDAGIVEIVRVEPGQRLIDIVEAAKPDVLIVDMSRPDRDSLESIREVSAQAPIVLFVDRDDPGFMQDAIDAGVARTPNATTAAKPAESTRAGNLTSGR